MSHLGSGQGKRDHKNKGNGEQQMVCAPERREETGRRKEVLWKAKYFLSRSKSNIQVVITP